MVSDSIKQHYIQSYWILFAGLLILIIPTIWSLATLLWGATDQEHGPILVAIFGWMINRELSSIVKLQSRGSQWGMLLIIPALLFYILGRSQQIWLFEVGSFIPLFAGIGIVLKGRYAIKFLTFPLLILIFAIPLPATIIDLLTSNLKQNISVLAETILYLFDYPIARSGVTLTIGNYQLLVADACSGINSLFSLFAVGLLYIYMQKDDSKSRNFIILLSIAPIALLANLIRVIMLVLITYYFGNEAGQGFIHGMAGIFMFAVSFFSIYMLDMFLCLFFKNEKRS